jgi:hypothetical protein
MKPGDFAPWAEQVIGNSPAVERVEPGGVGAGNDASPCGTRILFATGAQLHIAWISTSPPAGGGAAGEPDPVVSGPPPEPVAVPDLATTGRLATRDIERHLAALINNGGHEQVMDVAGYSTHPQLGSEAQPYGIRVRNHDGSAVFALFRQTLPRGQQPGRSAEFQQREEV